MLYEVITRELILTPNLRRPVGERAAVGDRIIGPMPNGVEVVARRLQAADSPAQHADRVSRFVAVIEVSVIVGEWHEIGAGAARDGDGDCRIWSYNFV